MNTATVAIARLDRASSSTGSRLRTGSGGGARAAWISSGGTPARWRVCWARAARDAPWTSRVSCSSISPLATRWRALITARSRARAGVPGGEGAPARLALGGQGRPERLGGRPDQADVELLGVVGPEQPGQE